MTKLPADQSFWSITSVDLMTALTVSPFFNPSSSALRRVMTLSMTAFPTRTFTWAMMSPSWMSAIFPLSWFLAESGIPRHYANPAGPAAQDAFLARFFWRFL